MAVARNRPKGASRGKVTRPGREGKPAQPPVREPSPLERLKLQIADELGLGEKVRREGWAMLTAAESGRVGGLLARRLKELGMQARASGR